MRVEKSQFLVLLFLVGSVQKPNSDCFPTENGESKRRGINMERLFLHDVFQVKVIILPQLVQ